MGEVASAVDAIRAQIAALHEACDGLSHRELVGLLSELTTVLRTVPALEHRALARLVAETEPRRLGEASWKKVLTTALRVSDSEAKRRLRDAAQLGPRQSLTGEPMAPVWEATAAAQARGALDAEHVAVIATFHEKLPGWVDVDTRAAADAQLAELGAGLTPQELKKAAARLAAMIDQDGPEPTDAERARRRGVTLGEQQLDGMSRLSGWVTPEWRAVYEAIEAKLATPGMCDPDDETPCVDGEPDREPAAQRHPQPRSTPTTTPGSRSAAWPCAPGAGPAQRVTGHRHRLHHPPRTREGRRGGGHRRRIPAADGRPDSDGLALLPLPGRFRPAHQPSTLPGPHQTPRLPGAADHAAQPRHAAAAGRAAPCRATGPKPITPPTGRTADAPTSTT